MAEGPETRLIRKMRDAGTKAYGHRFVVIKIHGSEYSRAGVSDLLWTLDGIFGATEVKSPEVSTYKRKTRAASIKCALDKGPTLKQRLFVARILQASGCGGFAATVGHEEGFDGFMEQLACAEAMAAGAVCPGHNIREFIETWDHGEEE